MRAEVLSRADVAPAHGLAGKLLSGRKEGLMAATLKGKPGKKVKNLAAKKLTTKETSRVKGGYIGETEKNRSGPAAAGAMLPAVQKNGE
jgi:hypothetical protein